uniref:Uncharacterized protein n=1 Tax=Solanum lycopersicum TaxID=4081 RepID=K4B6J9_SOLLC
MLKTAGTFESYTVSAHILNFSFLQTYKAFHRFHGKSTERHQS